MKGIVVFSISFFTAFTAFADVNSDGTFGHSISIKTPPGVNGVAPQLSLEYNSNIGNGMLGVGWILDGFPKIKRMDYGKGVTYTGQDTYLSSDGRLVDIIGNQSEYHTANETWSKYVPQGTCGDGPCSWTVYDKMGNTIYFGASEDSRIEAVGKNGSIRTWALNKFEDTYGNFYQVIYNEDTLGGDYYPKQVLYSNHSVEFGYGTIAGMDQSADSRLDHYPKYYQGTKIDLDQRLQWIEVKSNNQILRKYHFQYEYSEDNLASRLIQASQFGTTGTEQVIQKIKWAESESTFAPKTKWFYSSEANANLPKWVSNLNVQSDLIDMNGDRLLDRVEHYDFDTSQPGLWVSLNNGSGFNTKIRWFYASNSDANFPRWASGVNIQSDLIDMNGDGLVDRVEHYDFDTAQYGLWVSINNGNGFNTKTKWFYSSNGNGNLIQWIAGASTQADLIDMNGDGLPDRLEHYDFDTNQYGIWVSINNGNGFNAKSRWFHSSQNAANLLKWVDGTFVYSDLVDMNGDQLPDRIEHYDYDTNQYGLWVSINNGNGFNSKTKWFYSSNPHANYPQWIGGANVLSDLIDMNGDGLLDRVEHHDFNTNQDGLWVSINNGNGFNAKTKWFYTSYSDANFPKWVDAGNTQSDLIDMNGDGLVDRVEHFDFNTSQYGLWVSINNGEGFDPKTKWLYSSYGDANLIQWFAGFGVQADLVDMNGDGLPDRVIHYDHETSQYGLWVSINNGSGFNTKSKWFYASDSRANVLTWLEPSGVHSDLLDINGDGILDRVEHLDFDTNQYGLWVSLGTKVPERIVEVQEELGKVTRIEYELAANMGQAILSDLSCFGTSGLDCGISDQRPRYLVNRVLVSDGRLETGWTDNSQDVDEATRYEYHNARIYPGTAQERAYLGSEWYKKINEKTNAYEISYYRQDRPFHQRPQKVEKYTGSGKLLSSVEYDGYLLQNPYLGVEMVTFNKTITKSYLAGTLVMTNTKENVFDSYGYTTSNNKCIDGDCTLTEFQYTHDLSNWKFGQLDESKKTSGGILLKWERFSYLGNLLNSKESYFCQEALTCNTSSGQWVQVARNMLYDSFGHLTYTEDALGHGITTTYDDTFHTFVKSETNHLGHSMTNILDSFGRVEKEVDENGNATEYTYDEFGRKIKTLNAENAWSEKLFFYTGDPTKQYTENQFLLGGGVSWSREYSDGFGFQYKSEALGDGKTIIKERKRGYSNGLLFEETSLPRYSGDPSYWNKTEYNEEGKVSKITLASGNTMSYTYGPKWIKITEGTSSSTEYFNARSQLIRKVDAQGSEIRYEYGANQKLVKVILPNGQESTISYDSWGRKTSATETATGKTEYQYDWIGNVTHEKDNLNRVSIYQYDELNRLIKRTNSLNQVTTYTYDDPALSNSKGRLSKVEDPSGSIQMSYDSLGNVTTTTSSIQGLSGSFVYSKAYDQRNRPTRITSPNNSVQEYIYTIAGNLSQVKLDGQIYATYSDYLASGKVGKKVTNNDVAYQVSTEYSYDEQGTLDSLSTQGPNGESYQNLSYAFDNGGNVTIITDNRSANDKLVNGVNTDETRAFSYDSLNRLTQSAGVHGTRDFSYDSVGNILTFESKVKRNFSYNGQQVISGDNFDATYDTIGNMTTKTMDGVQWDYSYDDQNRLIEVKKDNTTTLQFGYNYAGVRTKKVAYRGDGSYVTTWYVGPNYEIREDSSETAYHKVTQHIQSGKSQKIASITKLIAGTASQPIPTGPYTPIPINGPAVGTWFYHSNHLGSSSLITDAQGNEATRILYLPFGEVDSSHSVGEDQVTSKFTGQELDEESGLMYYGARYYDPSIGRFLTADTFVPDGRNIQAHNRYAYVENNPISYTDPTGHSVLSKAWDNASDRVTDAYQSVTEGIKELIYHPGEYIQTSYQNIGRDSENFVKNPNEEFRRNQNLRFVIQAVAYAYGPWGAAAYSAYSAKAYGGSDSDAMRAAAIGGASAYATQSISSGSTGREGFAVNAVEAGTKAHAQGLVQGVSTVAQGGNFDEGYQRGVQSAIYGETVKWITGSEPTYEKGGGSGPKPSGTAVVNPRNNNIGKTRGFGATGSPSFIEEGGALSVISNEIPGMNSGSVLHDYIANALEVSNPGILGSISNFVTNQMTIAPVIYYNYQALGQGIYEYEDQLRESGYRNNR